MDLVAEAAKALEGTGSIPDGGGDGDFLYFFVSRLDLDTLASYKMSTRAFPRIKMAGFWVSHPAFPSTVAANI